MEDGTTFDCVLSSEQELRELLGFPGEVVARKTVHALDSHCKDYIARSPFLLIATSDRDGSCDVSPRGDAPGFVLVLDEHRLAIPERPGNRRMDSLRNIVSNPHIGLIFLIPGLGETLRVNGRAYVTKDERLLAQMQANGKTPQLAVGVVVEECYMHCAKAFMRSNLWKPDSWLSAEERPSAARILAAHTATDERHIARSLEESYTKRLY